MVLFPVPVVVAFGHVAGIIIALGSVTVVDILGVLSRRSVRWTQVTIAAHHVTKPLIWVGSGIITVTWLLMASVPLDGLEMAKSVLLGVMILNGGFLSFYVSPRLDELAGEERLFPWSLQWKVIASAAVSFCSWWLFTYLTVYMLV